MSKRKANQLQANDDEDFSSGDDFSQNNKENRENGETEDNFSPDTFEAGLITRIYMEDFMCHRKFTIELGRRVNFITGQNGSGSSALFYKSIKSDLSYSPGKSAIVAAIQLCLGATARNTGRGTT